MVREKPTDGELNRAVRELRKRLQWSQEQLGQAIGKYGKPSDHVTISRWERGMRAPSPAKCVMLARIAAKYRCMDLAAIFRAPLNRLPRNESRAPVDANFPRAGGRDSGRLASSDEEGAPE